MVFLAAYTPGAVNFVVGQASFTVFVVVLFNILRPRGLAHRARARAGRRHRRRHQRRRRRAALAAWCSRRRAACVRRPPAGRRRPRPAGARGDPRRPAARRGGPGRGQRRRRGDRAVAALEDLALEHGGGSVDRQAWGTLLLDAGLLRLAGDGITRSGAWYPLARDCGPARAALAEEGRTVCTQIDQDADLVERTGVARTAARGRRLPARAAESGRLPGDPRVRRPRRRGRSRLGARVAGAGDRASTLSDISVAQRAARRRRSLLQVLTGRDPFDLTATVGLLALGEERADEHDALALLPGDLRPVVGVGGVGQVLVLAELLPDRVEEVLGGDALLSRPRSAA